MAVAGGVGDTTSAKRTSRRWVLLAVTVFCAYEAVLLLRPWDRFGQRGFVSVASSMVTLVSAVACFRRGQFEHGRGRRAWRALAGGSVCVSVGLLLVGYDILVHHLAPDRLRGTQQLLFTLSLLLTWTGLLMLAGRSRLASRVQAALDGLIMAGSCLFVGWVLALGQVYRSTTLSHDVRIATVSYLLTGIADVAFVLIVAVRWEGNRRTLVLLGMGFASIVYSSFLFALFSARYVGRPQDFGTFLGFMLIALAAADRPSEPADDPAALRRQWRLALGLPYVCVLAVAGTVAFQVATGGHLDLFLGWLGALIGGLVLVRLLLTLLENRSVTLDLEQRVAERTQELRSSQERFRSLVQNSSDVITVVDSSGLVTYASPAVRGMLGYPDEQVTGAPFLTLVHPADRDGAERSLRPLAAEQARAGTLSCRLQRKDGTWCQVEAMLSPLREGQARSVVLNIRDVTERAALEEQLRHQALHDVLTTLANRRLFNERVRHALGRAQRTGEDLAVLFIDLDNFKRLNDSAGHGAGDELLVAVADRLCQCLRPADTAARLGGDEFGVLLEGTTLAEAEVVAHRIVTSLGAPHRTGGRDLVLGASVGIAGCRGGSLDYDALLRDADLAMYQAKASGRGRYVVFDPDMRARLLRQVELEAGLREAIADNGLELHYQPIVNLLTGHITGVEALTRWTRPDQGAVPASLFIPLAEESGLIASLDRWVLEQVCRQVRAWQLRYPRHAGLTANINFSALELQDSSYHDAVAAALARSGLAANDIMLEITETAVLPQQEASLSQLTALRDLGVRISLDDFGTGYSSLATLRQLPLDEIKIDGSFVEALQDGQRPRGIIRAIVELAEALEVHTVAEGIESTEQLTALRALRCVSGQGYLFAPSMPAQQLEPVLERGLTALGPLDSEIPQPRSAPAPRFTS